jgi:glutamate synthase domain-containing protein 3
MPDVDLARSSLRDLNAMLHAQTGGRHRILHPRGAHAVAVGIDAPVEVIVEGHVGYYCAGMNKQATVTILGNAGPGVAENLMSGTVRVTGNASQYAGASGRGGLLVIEGDASSRCGISMKGIDIVVGGSIGHMGAFMAQAGNLVVCGDCGSHLGDSIYEARIYVRGKIRDLGADCVEKPMTAEHVERVRALLDRAGIDADPSSFRRYGSARRLYHFHVDHADAY